MDETRKMFTIDEVNRTIPALERRLVRLEERFEQLGAAVLRTGDPRQAGLEGGRPVPMQYFLGVQEILEEGKRIEENGIIVRDLRRGLIDFPSVLHGQNVFLCWLRGERKIGFFHEPDVGFGGRKPIPPDAG